MLKNTVVLFKHTEATSPISKWSILECVGLPSQTAKDKKKKGGRKWRAKKIKVGHLSLFEFKMISVWQKPTMQIKPPCITHRNYEPQVFVTDKFGRNVTCGWMDVVKGKTTHSGSQ